MDLLKLNPGIRRPSDMVVDKALSWEKIKTRDGLGACVYVGTINYRFGFEMRMWSNDEKSKFF